MKTRRKVRGECSWRKYGNHEQTGEAQVLPLSFMLFQHGLNGTRTDSRTAADQTTVFLFMVQFYVFLPAQAGQNLPLKQPKQDWIDVDGLHHELPPRWEGSGEPSAEPPRLQCPSRQSPNSLNPTPDAARRSVWWFITGNHETSAIIAVPTQSPNTAHHLNAQD